MRKLNHIPGPAGRAAIGSLLPYARDRNRFIAEAVRVHGDVCRIRLPIRDAVVLGHPNDAARYLNDTTGDFQKLGYRLPGHSVVGGLAFQEGEGFRDKRSSVASMFAGASLARIFARVADTVDARMDAEIAAARRDADIVDLQAVLSRLLLPGLLTALFTDTPGPDETRIVDQGLRLAMKVFGFIRLAGGPPILLRGPDHLPAHAVVRLYRAVSARVRARRAVPADHDDILQALCNLQTPNGSLLDDLAVTNELVLLLSASYGAMTAGFAHTFARVLGSPDSWTRLCYEAEELDPTDRSLGAIRQRHWAKACFEEALRLQGSAPLVRIAAVASRAGVYDIPVGTPLVLPLNVIHRDPRWWPRPDTYDPGRFQEVSGRSQRQALVYLPFGSGPHRCMASQLAYAVAQHVLTTIPRRYDMAALPGWSITEVPGLAPMIKGGLPIRMTPRRLG